METSLGSSSDTFMAKTYGWTALATLVAAGSAFWLIHAGIPVVSPLKYLLFMVAGFVLLFLTYHTQVFGLKLVGLFGFSAVEGASISGILLMYGMHLVSLAFLIAAADFGTMALIGTTVRHNFARMGHQLMAAIIGLIVVEGIIMILCWLHIIVMSPLMAMVISGAGVVIFSLYTIFDSQRIVQAYQSGIEGGNFAIDGALSLFLDFLNLFMDILQLLWVFNSNRN